MAPSKFGDPIADLLWLHRDAVIREYIHRAQAASPVYQARYMADLWEPFSRSLDWIMVSISRRDAAPVGAELEDIVRRQLHQGFPAEVLIQGSDIVEAVIRDLLRRELPGGSLPLLDGLRRIARLMITARHVISRVHLAELLRPTAVH